MPSLAVLLASRLRGSEYCRVSEKRHGVACSVAKKKTVFADRVPSRRIVMRNEGKAWRESEKEFFFFFRRTVVELKGALLQRIGSLLVIAISMRC